MASEPDIARESASLESATPTEVRVLSGFASSDRVAR